MTTFRPEISLFERWKRKIRIITVDLEIQSYIQVGNQKQFRNLSVLLWPTIVEFRIVEFVRIVELSNFEFTKKNVEIRRLLRLFTSQILAS